MVVLAMAVSAMAMARGPLTQRLMPTTAMGVMVDTDLDTPLDTAMADTATLDKRAKGCCRELQPVKYAASQNWKSKEIFLFLNYIFSDVHFHDVKTKCDKK